MDKNKIFSYLIAMAGFIVVFIYSSERKKSQDSLTYCTVTKFDPNKFGYSRLTYEYQVDGVVYEYTELKEYRNRIKENDSYLITYKSGKPEIHNPIFTMKYTGERQIDSLLLHVGAENLGSVWNANNNSANRK